jgi:hypothetical protein
VVLYSAADHSPKTSARIGLLITWTVFESGSARGFRLGVMPNGPDLRVDEIGDLTCIQPFPDATNETSIYAATRGPGCDGGCLRESSTTDVDTQEIRTD